MSRVMAARLHPVRALVVDLVDHFNNFIPNTNSLSSPPHPAQSQARILVSVPTLPHAATENKKGYAKIHVTL